MKKIQRMKVATAADVVDLVQEEISWFLWNNHQIKSNYKVITDFKEDPEQIVEFSFLGTDELAAKVEDFVKANYQFTDEKSNVN